jgi:hypothetical protein
MCALLDTVRFGAFWSVPNGKPERRLSVQMRDRHRGDLQRGGCADNGGLADPPLYTQQKHDPRDASRFGTEFKAP